MGLITMLIGRTSKSKKLQKKYIGDHIPEDKKSNDDSINNLLL